MRRPPKLSRHKASNRAFVWIDGKRHYMGKWDSPESLRQYRQLLAGLNQAGVFLNHSVTVSELCKAFLCHAESIYSKGEASNCRSALQVVKRLYGRTFCDQFGPKRLKEIREELAKKHCRTQINNHIHRIRKAFRWGVENEMVPASIVTGLQCVKSLRKGASEVADSEPVKPVPESDVQAVLPLLTSPVAAMIRIQLLTGARPSEVRLMVPEIFDFSKDVWEYRPRQHKNAWRGKERIVLVGPKAQEILKPFLANRKHGEFLFCPQDGREEFVSKTYRTGAKVTVKGSEQCRQPYSLTGFINSIYRACDIAGVPRWSPGQLRHSAATRINAQFGDIDAARVVLGHSEKSTTEIYAERDLKKAAQIARVVG